MLRPRSMLFVALAMAPAVARADERAEERFDTRDGLPNADTTALAQDAAGFVWVGTNGGVARFDGETFVHWAVADVRGRVTRIALAGDRVYAAEDYGDLWALDPVRPDEPATLVRGPDGEPLLAVHDLLADDDGALWVVVDQRLRRRGPGGDWSEPFAGCFDGEPVLAVAVAPGAPLHVATAETVWRAPADGVGCPQRLAAAHSAYDLLVTEHGDVHVLELSGRWWRVRDGARTLLHAPPMQGRSLAVRGDDVWAAYSGQLAVLRPSGEVRSWGAEGGMARGGWLLVDHEGSLWVATTNGLVHYFEPDTIITTLHDGDAPVSLLYLTEAADAVLVTSWRGGAAVTTESGTPSIGRFCDEARYGVSFHERSCREVDGVTWGTVYRADGWLVWEDGQWTQRPTEEPVRMYACAEARDGGVWLAAAHGLHRSTEDLPIHVADYPWSEPRTIHRAFEDDAGHLWLAAGREVCELDVPGGGTWRCDTMPARVVHLVGFAQVDGALLAATATDGLYARLDGQWQRLAGSDRLGSRWMYALRPSPRGGVWTAGSGIAARIRLRPDHPDGFEIVERLGRRHGVIDDGIHDVLERPDGGLWIAGAAGLTRIPPHVRGRSPAPAKLAIVRATVDGKRLPLGETVSLPHEPGMLELEFAALTFADREQLRFRVQMSPDGAWSEPFERPVLQLYNPPAGAHAIRVSVSTDGEQWSSSPDVVRLDVAEPFHRRPWFWGLVGFGLAVATYGLHRARMTVRHRLVQQRLRIAMDLHDDLGSGLGSIGLVADLLSRPELDRSDKQQLAHDIRRSAAELGDSLRSLVWTLSDDRDSLESLGLQLADRAATVLPDVRPRLVTQFPSRWPAVELSLPVRRNLQMMAQEALHNAARHANADTVTLGLRLADAQGVLWVEDDGIGGVDLARSRTGMGLSNLQRRADEIGARLSIGSGAGGRGTRVEVTFDPWAHDRRLRRRMSARRARS